MADADARLWEERLGPSSRAPVGRDTPTDSGGPEIPPVRETGPGVLAPPPERRREQPGAGPERRPLALMLDWENIKISLADLIAEMPDGRAQALRSRIAGVQLATRLGEAAWRHGLPRQRWAVADWDRPTFEGDQKAVKSAGYFSDIAGGEKFNSSDHVLREKIHLVLRQHPEIAVFVIGTGDGDFHEAIRTLQQEGKQVVLWATRRAVNGAYGGSLRGPDRIQIEWLEDLVFGEEIPRGV